MIDMATKKYIVVAGCLLLLLAGASPAAAARDLGKDINAQLGAGAGEYGADFGSPADPRLIVANVIKVLLSLMGTIFTVLILIGGFKFLTAHGDEEKAKDGQKIIRGAIIGFIVVLVAYSITVFVASNFSRAVIQGGQAGTVILDDEGNIVR